MVATATHSVRKPFLARQLEDSRCLAEVYDKNIIPVKEEIRGLNIHILAKRLGSTPNKMATWLGTIESAGVLKRSLDYPKGGIGGRIAVWSLTADKHTGLKMLEAYHEQERIKASTPPTSLKERILTALRENPKGFNSPREISKAIAHGTERFSVHRITAALGSLKDEGIVTYKLDNSGHHSKTNGKHGHKNVMYNIHLNGNRRDEFGTPERETTETITRIAAKHHSVGVDPTDFRNLSRTTEGGPIERVLPIVTALPLAEQYPLIAKMAKRREFLENAAQLASDGGEDDIAMSLLEKASQETSPLNTEILRMWDALNKCGDK